MDTLIELPIENWPLLQEKIKILWPFNIAGYYTLDINMNYSEVREAMNFKVYCPYGNMDYGFVSIHVKEGQSVTMFSITEDTSKVEEALLKTQLIDWSHVTFEIVNSIMVPTLERIVAIKQIPGCLYNVKMFYLRRSTKLADLSLPINTYVSAIKLQDIQRVNDAWPYKHKFSHTFFTTFANNGLSYGIYSSITDELLAWVFINEFGFLNHIYCEEKHRGRGYASCVLKSVTNDLLRNSRDAYCYVLHGNAKAISTFTNVGFEPVDDAVFLFGYKSDNKSKI